ncbi:MAG: hypothetical protein IJ736_15095 [Firmicutes bacterium]|nr:hypothetical protein [Bacillota bacterium]
MAAEKGTIKNNIRKILQLSTPRKQKIKAMEELSELIRAIARYEIYTGSIKEILKNGENIVEEMADVQIMLYQLKMIYGIKEKEVDAVMLEKTERTIERLGADDKS